MFEWAAYHTLARELATRSGDEAALRTAVSRAYYAAFCRARNFFCVEKVSIPMICEVTELYGADI